jgi:hypothetical protein
METFTDLRVAIIATVLYEEGTTMAGKPGWEYNREDTVKYFPSFMRDVNQAFYG